ncbi:MAG: peptide chain release factor 1 [Fibromonadales bacterium]|nr:peptide chain release factor 1 [Fibromonadales bacterium]
MQEKVRKFLERYEELEQELSQPDVAADPEKFSKLHKSFKALEKTYAVGSEYMRLCNDLREWKEALEGSDAELATAAKAEIGPLENQIEGMESSLQILMVPPDPFDNRNAILEIRAGTGGDESSLFAGDLFKMYRAYLENRGFKVEITDISEGTVGGFKEICLFVRGDGAYGVLKFESGAHRVQRVPETESQGRVHTSAATVAVMPEAEEVDVEIRNEDLKVDVYRASGAGGQYINKTDSAVRITHVPSGVVVACQTERSQIQNRSKAMELLRSRLFDHAISEKQKKEAAERKSLVGTGDRSDKIRTYNFPQNRVTDHRINLTLYNLEKIVQGDLQSIIDALHLTDAQNKLGKA